MNSLRVRALVLALFATSLVAVTPTLSASAEPPVDQSGSCVLQTNSSAPYAAVGPASSYVAAGPGSIKETLPENLKPCGADLVQPLTYFAPVSSPFGVRVHPITGATTMHYGTDYSRSGINGAAIRSIEAGTVVGRIESYSSSGTGNSVIISHTGNVRSQYMHMSRPTTLSIGDRVSAGQVLGYVGTTGGSTGPHLHLEVRVDNVHIDPFVFLGNAPYLR